MFPQHLLKGVALAALALGSLAGAAQAGGFAVREQSAEYQGMSFAGNAAGGGGLSGMFWNPAVIGEFEGFQTDSAYSLIIPSAEITGTSALGTGSSGDMGPMALVPASYASYQVTDDLVAGVSLNAPFGLGNKTDYAWVGQTFNRQSEVKTYNGQFALAYNVSPEFTIGGGLLVEYMSADLRSASGVLPTSPSLIVRGDDYGFGFTAGAIWRPTEATNIGVGFRSAIKHDLKGDVSIPNSSVPIAAQLTPVGADVTLPETLTLSVRQDLTDDTRLLATAEWTNWSRLQNLTIVCSGAANPVYCPAGAGQTVRTLEFGWHDGYFFSAGLEHDLSDALTLRGGVAYEMSPIRAADERSLRVPDSDRYWLSLGASYQVSEKIKANLAYSHVFMDDGNINRIESGLQFIGKSESSLDILSAGFSVDY